MRIHFPAIFAIDERWEGNLIQQLCQPDYWSEFSIDDYVKDRVEGYVLTSKDDKAERMLVIVKGAKPPKEFSKVFRLRAHGAIAAESLASELSKGKWICHPKLAEIAQRPVKYKERVENVVASWHEAFSYLEENVKEGMGGLRSPQIGAVHAAHAHWVVSNEPASIVMPTGTGKTESMLSVLVSEQCSKLLVVVPTDALRAQIAHKFLTLGILKDFRIVTSQALYPLVGTLKHKPKTLKDVDAYFEKCNVVITTMNVAGQCASKVQERMAYHCPYLFIDEAHHTPARTWQAFKKAFKAKRILQFTATPFRSDDKPVGGKIIFNYPLRKAQENGYFGKIRFKPVTEYDPRKADLAIAEKAVEQLREDSKKYNHILMARVRNTKRANEVFRLYEKYKEFKAVQIHTGITSARKREQTREEIVSGESRIVVCVDMLGEGFDLPELKIAAFHDVRKSLPVTLQLAGRFTRSKPNIGDATFIANIADVNVREELRKLYAQDADWNFLLRQSSEEAIEEQADLWKFIEGFENFPEEIPMQNIRPAMSTAIYRTTCSNWTPKNFRKGIRRVGSTEKIFDYPNEREKTLVIVTARKVPIDWAQTRDIFNWDWELYVVFWDQDQNLLFINSSSNRGYYVDLARAVAGQVDLIRGPPVFRCFSGVNRLKLQNVGLIEQLGRLIRYTMRAGSDVESGLSEAQKRNAMKSNIFGVGYEDGKKVSVGCSYKGRIWSRRTANIGVLTKWCSFVGRKVLDDAIDPDKVLRGTLRPIVISKRPVKMPIGIEWPEVMYRETETVYTFIVDGKSIPLYEADIVLKNPSVEGELRFEIASDDLRIELTLILFEKDEAKDCRFAIRGRRRAAVRQGRREIGLEQFFYENPPMIWFADGSSLEGSNYTELKAGYPPYPANSIKAWDWTGINIKKESQGIDKASDSIQHQVIQRLKKRKCTVIFNDDYPGEAADVVTITVEKKKAISVEFYHCKFSASTMPGSRIDDLYAVCGQAQKCIHWMEKPTELFAHLLRREPMRKGGKVVTRFEKGNAALLHTIRERSMTSPVELAVYIVQPGLSKSRASTSQLELLSVTQNYLMETYKLPFGVIASA